MSSRQTGIKAAEAADKKNDVSFSAKLNDFIRKNRMAFLVAGAAIVVAIAAIGIGTLVGNARLEKATAALESLDKDLEAWSSAEEADKAAKGDAVIAAADAVAAKFGKVYAGLEARMTKARVLADRKDYAGAEAAYVAVVDAAPKSHLAPVALVNAAAMAENAGNAEAALGYLARADKEYPDMVGADHVLFSMGRMYEGQKQYDKAMEAYLRLVAVGSESDWTKLAHDRIILLKSQGLAK